MDWEVGDKCFFMGCQGEIEALDLERGIGVRLVNGNFKWASLEQVGKKPIPYMGNLKLKLERIRRNRT